jgi:hypothetical protein
MSIPRVNVLIFSLLASIFCTTAESEIYKVVDKNTGKVTYTNTKPLEGSSSSFEKISEKPINSLGGSSSVTESSTSYRPTTSHESSSVEEAFDNHQSNVQVSGYGRVKKILPLDNNGSRHQKFILQLPSGKTLLVAHNIDLAPEITRRSLRS